MQGLFEIYPQAMQGVEESLVAGGDDWLIPPPSPENKRMSPVSGTLLKGTFSSSNHQFARDILVFGGVSILFK